MRYYTDEKLGSNRSRTPEGFLVCKDVPIARVGNLLYAAGEVPVDAGKDGIVAIERHPEDVFSSSAIASFEGKPVTNDHPPFGVKVDPSNWRKLAIGDVRNVRRGDGRTTDDNFLYADLIIKDASAIKDVEEGKKEVSAGYDAEYEQLAPGHGRQHDIIGNHVALVDRGRCGPQCAIGDADTMAMKRGSFADRMMKAFKTRDEGAMVEELGKVQEMLGDVVSDEMPSGLEQASTAGSGSAHHITLNVNGSPAVPSAPASIGTSKDEDPGMVADPAAQPAAPAADPAIAQIMQRLDTIEQAIMLLAQEEEAEDDGGEGEPAPDVAEKKPAEDDAAEMGNEKPWPDSEPGKVEEEKKPVATGDRRAAVGDSTSLAPLFQDTLARAAVLAPGLKLPTYDAARSARQTHDDLCNFRRIALAKGWSTDAQPIIDRLRPTRGKADFSRDAMTCEAVTLLFNGASELRRQSNTHDAQNSARTAAMLNGREVAAGAPRVLSPAEINARNREKYGQKTA